MSMSPWYPPQPPMFPPHMPIEPLSGRPYSGKNRTSFALLQVLLGMIGIGGIGRMYAGHVGLGVGQLITGIVCWIIGACFAILIFPLILPIGAMLWFVIDGLVTTKDGQQLPLRP